MNTWNTLVKQCILGSEREVELNLPEAIAARKNAWESSSKEQMLLNTLASTYVYQSVGESGWVKNTHINIDESLEETLDYCSEKVSRLMLRLVEQENHFLLSELLSGLTAKNKIVKPVYIPVLLALGDAQKQFLPSITSVIGKRGDWLIRQNSDWVNLFGGAKDNLEENKRWMQARGKARIILLSEQLSKNFAETFKDIQTVWVEELAKDRLALLETLIPYVNDEMHAWLKECLKDRSQNVRNLAAQYLVLLKDSDLYELITDFVHDCFTFSKSLTRKVSLAISLPDVFDERWAQLGIPNSLGHLPNGSKVGNKAGWLYSLIGFCDIESLAKENNISIEQLLNAANKSEYSEAMLLGLDNAALLHTKTSFLSPRLNTISHVHEKLRWITPFVQKLEFEQVQDSVASVLKDCRRSKAQEWKVGLALLGHLPTLDKKFADIVCDFIERSITGSDYFYKGERDGLDELGFKLPLACYDQYHARLSKAKHDHFETLLRNYQLHRELNEELNHE